ncbi:MAG: heavy metal translocating P-type ATPase metal-binding domain-containing protein [Niabella sp.]
MKNDLTDRTTRCYHCGDECGKDQLIVNDKHFCCSGCKLVYELLNENDLCTYYSLNAHPGNQQQPKRKNKFAYLDKEEIASRLISFEDEQQAHITFSVPQMHCSSCLWLLEHLGDLQKGILTSRVNFVLKEVFIVFDKQQATLRDIVEAMAAVGYEPCLSLDTTKAKQVKTHSRTAQIAVAGFCFANIMMLSLPEYFSMSNYLQEKIGTAFRYTGFVLTLPVFFYCAREFFSNALSSVKNKYLNIDASIALAILLTFLRSIYNLFILNGNTYFDSMSGIVFFMLVGRWVQDKTQRSLVFDRDYKSFFPIAVNVKRNNTTEPVLISTLAEKDIIEVFDQEIIPADGFLVKGKALIDYSFVTGESLPKQIEPGSIIYAGGRQIGEQIELMVIKKSDRGYLTNLWNRQGKSNTGSGRFLHKAGNYFTITVFALTIISALFWCMKGEYTTMWNALTTTLIVACPCALLLASTFTNGNVMRILSRSGLFLKNADLITTMSRTNHIVLDKTGTITLNKNFRITYLGKQLSDHEKILIASLCKHSTHPLSKAIFDHLKIKKLIAVDSFSNIPGKGIEGWVDETYMKIGSREFVAPARTDKATDRSSQVFIWQDGTIHGFFELENVYRPGLRKMLQHISRQFKLSILSGDNDHEYGRITGMTGTESDIRFNQSPEDKYNYISRLQAAGAVVLMAGDGLNDAGALRKSDTGIAVMEGNNAFTPASDGIINAAAFTNLGAMIAFTKKAKRVITTSFIVSILYNIVGLFFALQGLLAPVIAAILMPVSTISIILITFLMTEWYGRKLVRIAT